MHSALGRAACACRKPFVLIWGALLGVQNVLWRMANWERIRDVVVAKIGLVSRYAETIVGDYDLKEAAWHRLRQLTGYLRVLVRTEGKCEALVPPNGPIQNDPVGAPALVCSRGRVTLGLFLLLRTREGTALSLRAQQHAQQLPRRASHQPARPQTCKDAL